MFFLSREASVEVLKAGFMSVGYVLIVYPVGPRVAPLSECVMSSPEPGAAAGLTRSSRRRRAVHKG